MKRLVGLAAIGGAAVAALIGFGLATMSSSSGGPAVAQTPAPTTTLTRTVTVAGVGAVSAVPDTATVNLGVQIDATTATDALDTASTKAQRIIDTLVGAGVAKADIQTGYISVYPDDRHGYVASNSVTATIHDVTKAGPIIDAAAHTVGNGITLGGVSFSVSDTGPLYAKARQLAVADARQRAQQLATAAGTSVGDVMSIVESSRSIPTPVIAAGAAAPPTSAAPPIEPGRQDIQLSVQVVFSLGA
jgi:uncharacterized protein YggE